LKGICRSRTAPSRRQRDPDLSLTTSRIHDAATGRYLMGKLEGKVALVTGSGRNIGRATVLKLAAEGAHVIVNARSNQAEADAVVREAQSLGVRALAVIADVGEKHQMEAMAERALSEFGRVDILINNAAIRPHKPFTQVTAADGAEPIRSDTVLYR
jgi:NAD(P)-dependent dehydrogenase (short-subunit alcohol dehydrogenase family)